jgi:pimeloyl-ACP methyl ester carboxylesterase
VFQLFAPPSARSASSPEPSIAEACRGRRVGPQGQRAHCVELGPAAAPLALLVHGLGGLAEEISAPLEQPLLAAGFRVLAVDRPGYGASDPQPANAMGPSAQAAWLARLLERDRS